MNRERDATRPDVVLGGRPCYTRQLLGFGEKRTDCRRVENSEIWAIVFLDREARVVPSG